MIRRPPRSTQSRSSAASDVYKRQLLDRAWDVRKEVVESVQKKKVTPHTMKIWEATVKDRENNFSLGPFRTQDEVSNESGTDRWIPTERFAREQKNKIRGVDSATVNDINPATAISEDLALASTDENVNLIMAWHRASSGKTGKPAKLKGWVLDEKDAYRQIGVRPDQMEYAVIAMKKPPTRGW